MEKLTLLVCKMVWNDNKEYGFCVRMADVLDDWWPVQSDLANAIYYFVQRLHASQMTAGSKACFAQKITLAQSKLERMFSENPEYTVIEVVINSNYDHGSLFTKFRNLDSYKAFVEIHRTPKEEIASEKLLENIVARQERIERLLEQIVNLISKEASVTGSSDMPWHKVDKIQTSCLCPSALYKCKVCGIGKVIYDSVRGANICNFCGISEVRCEAD